MDTSEKPEFVLLRTASAKRDRAFPQSLTNQSLGAESGRGPRLHPSCGEEFVKFVVTAALKQARQADGCPDYMLEGLAIGPGAPHHADHSVCIFVDQVRVLGDLAPAIFERSQLFDAVVLHRLEQSLDSDLRPFEARIATTREGPTAPRTSHVCPT
jgi:hypothetical protein